MHFPENDALMRMSVRPYVKFYYCLLNSNGEDELKIDKKNITVIVDRRACPEICVGEV